MLKSCLNQIIINITKHILATHCGCLSPKSMSRTLVRIIFFDSFYPGCFGVWSRLGLSSLLFWNVQVGMVQTILHGFQGCGRTHQKNCPSTREFHLRFFFNTQGSRYPCTEPYLDHWGLKQGGGLGNDISNDTETPVYLSEVKSAYRLTLLYCCFGLSYVTGNYCSLDRFLLWMLNKRYRWCKDECNRWLLRLITFKLRLFSSWMCYIKSGLIIVKKCYWSEKKSPIAFITETYFWSFIVRF